MKWYLTYKPSLKILVLLLYIFMFKNAMCQSESFETDSLHYLYINPSQLDELLTEKEKSIVINALLTQTSQGQNTVKLKVDGNDNLFSIVHEKYNYYDGEDFHTTRVISEKIKELNAIGIDDKIYKGQYLSIPVLPKNPSTHTYAAMKYTQLVSENATYNNNVILTDSLIVANKTIQKNISQQNAGLWAYPLTPEEINRILDSIPEEILAKIYGPALLEVGELKNIDLQFSENTSLSQSVYPLIPDSIVKSIVSQIDKSFFGTYYLLDYYNGSLCTHGMKVFNVIQQTLSTYGIDTAHLKIIQIPINYYQNEDIGIPFLESYYGKMNDNSNPELVLVKKNGLSTIEKLKKQKKKNKESKAVPEIYLSATINSCYDKSPDIISTSFWGTTYEADVMPKYINDSTSFITAGLDEPGKKIEDIKNKMPKPNTKVGNIEPLYTCYTKYNDMGSIIVGCLMSDTSFYGMYSVEGNRVTTLGTGIGWGIPNISCINSTDFGTSFATPEIGSKLFIAKAYWRSRNMHITANEARVRILLSTDINPLFIGKFGSGGTLNLLKLIQASDGYSESLSGSINSIKISPGSYVRYNTLSSLPFKRGKDGICGLYTSGKSTYAFFEKELCWKPIIIDAIKLIIENNGVTEEINTIEQFTSQYKQIISLNN